MRRGATPTVNPFRVRRGSQIILTDEQRALCGKCGVTNFEHNRGRLRPEHKFEKRSDERGGEGER